jgi:hypothetical protein
MMTFLIPLMLMSSPSHAADVPPPDPAREYNVPVELSIHHGPRFKGMLRVANGKVATVIARGFRMTMRMDSLMDGALRIQTEIFRVKAGDPPEETLLSTPILVTQVGQEAAFEASTDDGKEPLVALKLRPMLAPPGAGEAATEEGD